MPLDDAIRKASAETDRVRAAATARQAAVEAAAEAAVPEVLALLTDARDRLRTAGIQPVHVIASRKPTLFRPAHFAPHAAVWEAMPRLAISLDDRIFELESRRNIVRDPRDARDRGLFVGDVYVVLGELYKMSYAAAQETTVRDHAIYMIREGYWRVEQVGDLAGRVLSGDNESYASLEDSVARWVVTATRR